MSSHNILLDVLNVNKLRLNINIQPIYYNRYQFLVGNGKIIGLDSIIGLRRNQNQNDSIMVVVDELSKEAHFILVKTTHKAANIVEIFMKQIFRLHGISKVIISNRDSKFTGNF